jgi:hypothetical protein
MSSLEIPHGALGCDGEKDQRMTMGKGEADIRDSARAGNLYRLNISSKI